MSAMPPTTHALPRQQRLRLMRSTRKLEAVLGETPLFLDAPAAPAAAPLSPMGLRHARSVSHTPTPAPAAQGGMRMPSLRRTASTRAAPPSAMTHGPRPLLVIDLPAPAARRASVSSAFTGELTPDVLLSADAPPSPLTPTFALGQHLASAADADALRRRKLAKVARTFGENVPPALVFPTSTASSAKGRRRSSTLSVPALTPRASTETFASSHSGSSGHSSREHLIPRARAADAAMYRDERAQGWSGEWGGAASNMDQVVRGLRELRAK